MDKSLLIQKQIKDNAEDLNNYVRDLKLWEEDMKRKDRQLSNESAEEVLPPVRRPKLSNKAPAKKDEKNDCTKKRIMSYDYSSWEKFDVDKACEEVDNEEGKINEENSEETAEQEEKYLKEKALYEKELGNKHVKASRWDEAIECYTKAIKAYPKDPVFFANRALCYLKKNKYNMVESDCTASLKLDPTYVKAFLRRAAAREAVGNTEDALYDLRNALKLEPNNKQALKDLERLKEAGNRKPSVAVNSRQTVCEASKEPITQNTTNNHEENLKPTSPLQTVLGNKIINDHRRLNKSSEEAEPDWPPCTHTIQPISKPPHLRSKKSLKRIKIFDIGPNTPQHVCQRKLEKSPSTSPTKQNPRLPVATSSAMEYATLAGAAVKPRSVLTVATPVEDVPPPPSTSVQFHKAWSSIKADHLRYRYLKQIHGANLAEIFKESLESGMFSSIVETLASEFTSKDEPVLSYLRGLSSVKRFSTLALFMSSSDKSNLRKLFDYCIKKGECSAEEISELRSLYELI